MECRICFYTTSWGRCYIKEYLDELEKGPVELFGTTLAKLKRMRIKQCQIYPLVKPVTGRKHKYKEIRPGGNNTARIFYRVQGKDIILLLSGYTKKEEKLKPSELKLADSIVEDLMKGGGTYEEYKF